MGIIDSFKDSAARSRIEDERYYATALREIENGRRRDGLWAKAVAQSMGNENKAQSIYISLVVQAMRDDDQLKNSKERAIQEDAHKILRPQQEEKRKNQELLDPADLALILLALAFTIPTVLGIMIYF